MYICSLLIPLNEFSNMISKLNKIPNIMNITNYCFGAAHLFGKDTKFTYCNRNIKKIICILLPHHTL